MTLEEEVMQGIDIHKLDDSCVSIMGDNVSFFYQVADKVCKKQFIGEYRYFGGLQCNYLDGSHEYAKVEKIMIAMAEKELNIKWEKKDIKL